MISPYKIKTDRFSSHRVIADYLLFQARKRKIEVLDLGCDTGFIGTLADHPNINFTGVDLSDGILKELPKIYGTKIKLDLNEKNWKINKQYDFVIFADIMEHLIDPVAAMEQVARLLKENGILILSVPNFVFMPVRLVILSGWYPQHPRGPFDKTHLYHYTRHSAKEFVNSSGFRINKEMVTNPPVLLNSIFYQALHFLAKLRPELFAYQFIFFCQK